MDIMGGQDKGKKPVNPGKGKGKLKMGVCQLVDDEGAEPHFKFKKLPVHAALKMIDAGKAKPATSASDCDALNKVLVFDEDES